MRKSKRRISMAIAVMVAIVGGLTMGTSMRANADASSWPNQCYYGGCKGCGKTCLGADYICCCQSGDCDEAEM